MSTRRDSKYASKRRAAVRKRTREIGRHVFAYSVIALLIIGTVSTVFVAQVGAPVVTPTATPASNPLSQFVLQADTLVASGSFTDAISLYNAYLAQTPDDAEVHFKVGRAYVDSRNPAPNYPLGLEHLQRAININPAGTFVAEAQSLITQYSSPAQTALAATSVATGTAASGVSTSVAVTATSTISVTGTSTTTAPSDIAPTAPITP